MARINVELDDLIPLHLRKDFTTFDDFRRYYTSGTGEQYKEDKLPVEAIADDLRGLLSLIDDLSNPT